MKSLQDINKPIKVDAFNAAGQKTGEATGTEEQGMLQELKIHTFEITTLKISGGRYKIFFRYICCVDIYKRLPAEVLVLAQPSDARSGA